MAYSYSEKAVLDEFCHMMDVGSSHIISRYLADDVVLDWYGRTIAGKQDVLGFLFREIHFIQHKLVQIENPRPLARKETFLNMKKRVNLKALPEFEEFEDFDEDSGFISGVYESNSDSSSSSCVVHTPCTRVAASFAELQIDSPKFTAPLKDITSEVFQTPKYFSHPSKLSRKMLNVTPHKTRSSCWDPELQINMIEAKGTVSFNKYEALHNTYLQWTRDCRLQLGYTCELYSERTLCFSLLSYQDDMPCRRNLSQIFEECD